MLPAVLGPAGLAVLLRLAAAPDLRFLTRLATAAELALRVHLDAAADLALRVLRAAAPDLVVGVLLGLRSCLALVAAAGRTGGLLAARAPGLERAAPLL
ncbi:MAG: hypothetical protein ACREQ5_34835, partial [Candidatus Dormibacteria bacterium]